jgi:hypothetical protein
MKTENVLIGPGVELNCRQKQLQNERSDGQSQFERLWASAAGCWRNGVSETVGKDEEEMPDIEVRMLIEPFR